MMESKIIALTFPQITPHPVIRFQPILACFEAPNLTDLVVKFLCRLDASTSSYPRPKFVTANRKILKNIKNVLYHDAVNTTTCSASSSS